MNKNVFLCIQATALLFWSSTLRAGGAVTPQEVQGITVAILGSKASLVDDKYVVGDFDGNGARDLAIMADVDAARSDIQSRHIPLIDLQGQPIDISKFGKHCMGLLIVSNYALVKQKTIPPSVAPLLAYACYSGLKTIPKGQFPSLKSKQPTPRLTGDVIALEMENGSSIFLYWDGKTFHSFEHRGGD